MALDIDLLSATRVADWSHLTPGAFWAAMRRRHWVEDRLPGGTLVSENELPKGLNQIPDDPYLAVAWDVAQQGGFRADSFGSAVYFWADYFRLKIPKPVTDQQHDEAVARGLTLARSPGTRLFPGANDNASRCAPELVP